MNREQLINNAKRIIKEDNLVKPKSVNVVRGYGREYSYSQHGKTEVRLERGRVVEARKVEVRTKIPDYNLTEDKLKQNLAHELAHLKYPNHSSQHRSYSRSIAKRL